MTQSHAPESRTELPSESSPAFSDESSKKAAELFPSHATRFLARQPILDAARTVIGYELLFRSGWENFFRGGADDATLQMLDNCVLMGVDNLTQRTLAFINCTREALVERMVAILPPATTVLEVLESVEPDQEVRAACAELRALGYRLALDDFRADSPHQELLSQAAYLKVDFRLSDARERSRIVKLAKSSGAVLLAEKIENMEEFKEAQREGFQLFQGYFFCRPAILAERELPANWANYMRLVGALAREPLNMAEVAPIVEAEASLCYRLLRLANSAAVSSRKAVTSVRSAMVLVGDARFRTLAAIALAAHMGRGQPEVLLQLALERARFCRNLAPLLGEDPNEQCLLGLLSLLSAMLRIPMTRLVNSLPLREKAKCVLLGAEGRTAIPLQLITALEAGDWTPCAEVSSRFGVSESQISAIYLEALHWAKTHVQQLGLEGREH